VAVQLPKQHAKTNMKKENLSCFKIKVLAIDSGKNNKKQLLSQYVSKAKNLRGIFGLQAHFQI
jgi:hypothetical protein